MSEIAAPNIPIPSRFRHGACDLAFRVGVEDYRKGAFLINAHGFGKTEREAYRAGWHAAERAANQ